MLNFAINNEAIQGLVPIPLLTNQPPFMEVGIMAKSSISEPIKICQVPGCGKKHRAKGYCLNHYMQFLRNNNPEKTKQVNAENHLKYRDKILERKRKIYESNKDKQRRRSLQWQKDNPEKKRITVLKTVYGLSEDSYRELIDRTKGVCPICKNEFDYKRYRVCVDHNHSTGFIRGLICSRCNSGLGFFGDNPESILRAYNYLK